MNCEDCEDTPATVTWTDPWGKPYAYLCQRCEDRRIDRHEPPTFDEALGAKCDAIERERAAWRLKR